VVIAVIAIFLGYGRDSKVLELVSYAWAGFGAAFGPVVILSLFWKRMTRNGALAGMITGAATVIIWKQLTGGLFDIYELLPGFIFATLAIVIFSFVGNGPTKEIQEEFDTVQARLKD
jgi:sodium/proline symporter